MPLTGLEPLDSSWQPARAFVINDRRLQANRVDHRPLAGCSLHNLGSGQQVAAGARRRGGAARIRSAAGFSCSGGATMCLGPVAKRAPFSLLLAASRRRPSKPRSSRGRPALDDRVRYPGLLAAYLPCGRVSQVAAKEARLPTRTSLLAPTCRIDGWMLRRTRSDNGQLGPIYALTCEARVAESMRESWGLMDYSTRGRGMTNKQQARRRFESRAWWTLFLEARRRSRERPKRARQG
jgi:hypothetical protein